MTNGTNKYPGQALVHWLARHPAACLLGVVALAYGHTVTFGLTGFDDRHLLDNVGAIQGIGALFLRNAIVFPGGLFYYRPMLLLTFWVTNSVGLQQPWCHHAVNILIHLGACLCLRWLLAELGISAPRALAATALFAVHPVLTQAAAWLPGRNDSLLVLFLIPAFIAALRFLSGGRWPWLLLALLGWLAALLAKETALLLPAIVAAAVWLWGRERGVARRRIVIVAAGYALVFAVYWSLRWTAAASQGDALAASLNPLSLMICQALTYFAKVFLPWELTPIPVIEGINVWPVCIGVVIGVIALALTVRYFSRRTIFGLVWFALFLAPAVAFASGFNAAYEHRLYIPLAGICIALAGGDLFRGRRGRAGWAAALAVTALLVAGDARIARYSRVFRNETSFWESAAASDQGSADVQYNLGIVYQVKGDYDRAAAQFLRTVSLAPAAAPAWYGLGVASASRGDRRWALWSLRRAHRLDPANADIQQAVARISADQRPRR